MILTLLGQLTNIPTRNLSLGRTNEKQKRLGRNIAAALYMMTPWRQHTFQEIRLADAAGERMYR